MDTKEVTQEEKNQTIKTIHDSFVQMKTMIDELDTDIESADARTQASAVWISGNLISMFTDFQTYLRTLSQTNQFNELKDDIEKLTKKDSCHE